MPSICDLELELSFLMYQANSNIIDHIDYI
jgi:hypothetical protein